MMQPRQIVERSVLFATEVLGSDTDYTSEELQLKARYHFFMSVQMTGQWLLDETIDADLRVDADFIDKAIRFAMTALESGNEDDGAVSALRAAGAAVGVPEDFPEAISLLARWQRALARELGISLAPESIYMRLNADFYRTYRGIRDPFNSWESFQSHRADNGALPMEIFCGAHLFCRRFGADPSILEKDERFWPVIRRYAIIGSLSNDIFGYQKDLEERVETSIEVMKRLIRGQAASTDEQLTRDALSRVIGIHNELLKELSVRLQTCEGPAETAVLLSSLTTTWAVRVLHHACQNIYRPEWLRQALDHLKPRVCLSLSKGDGATGYFYPQSAQYGRRRKKQFPININFNHSTASRQPHSSAASVRF